MWEQTACGQRCFTLPQLYLLWSHTDPRPPRPIMLTWELGWNKPWKKPTDHLHFSLEAFLKHLDYWVEELYRIWRPHPYLPLPAGEMKNRPMPLPLVVCWHHGVFSWRDGGCGFTLSGSSLLMLLAQLLVQLRTRSEQLKNSFQLTAQGTPYPWQRYADSRQGSAKTRTRSCCKRRARWEHRHEFTASETHIVLEDLGREAQQRTGQSTHAAPSKAEGSCRSELRAVQAAVQCKADFLWLAVASNLSCAPLQRIPEFNSPHWTFLLRLKSLKVFV